MTEKEKDQFIEQLQGEVSRWHHAYDALMIERNQLVNKIRELEVLASAKNPARG